MQMPGIVDVMRREIASWPAEQPIPATAMATLLHDVELALDPPGYTLTSWKIKGLPTRHPGKSLKFRLVRRRSASTGASAVAAASD